MASVPILRVLLEEGVIVAMLQDGQKQAGTFIAIIRDVLAARNMNGVLEKMNTIL